MYRYIYIILYTYSIEHLEWWSQLKTSHLSRRKNIPNSRKLPRHLNVKPICSMVLVHLPTWLGDFVRANVGIHIPAPWFAYGKDCKNQIHHLDSPWQKPQWFTAYWWNPLRISSNFMFGVLNCYKSHPPNIRTLPRNYGLVGDLYILCVLYNGRV